MVCFAVGNLGLDAYSVWGVAFFEPLRLVSGFVEGEDREREISIGGKIEEKERERTDVAGSELEMVSGSPPISPM